MRKVRLVPFVVAALMIGEVVVAGLVLWPAGSGDETGPVALYSLPSAPDESWRIDADEILGNESDRSIMAVKSATTDVLVAEAVADPYAYTSTLAAIDNRSGETLWTDESDGRWTACAVNIDDILSCVKTRHERGATVTHVHFFDVRSGDTEAQYTVNLGGPVDIASSASGFVVAATRNDSYRPPAERGIAPSYTPTAPRPAVKDGRTLLVGFSSSGERKWSTQTPVGQRELHSVDNSNLIAVEGTHEIGFSIYRIDTGDQVHRAAEPVDNLVYALAAQRKYSRSHDGRIAIVGGTTAEEYVLFDGGFAATATTEPIVRLFDDTGAQTGELSGWLLAQQPFSEPRTPIDDNHVPVVEWTSRRIGVVDSSTGTLLWTHDSPPHTAITVRAIGDGSLALVRDFPDGHGSIFQTWQVADADTGDTGEPLSTRFGQWFLGSDGERLILSGDENATTQPNIPRLTAFSDQTGEQIWQIEPISDSSTEWKRLGRSLYLQSQVGTGPSWIARYS